MSRLVIAYDLGGTNVRCGVVDEDANILARGKQSTGTTPDPDTVVAKMASMADECLKSLGKGRDDVACVGIGSPGPLDSRTGMIIETPNLGWKNVPLAPKLQEALGRSTFLENDANSALWGEFWKGAGQGCQTMFILTLGTGVGGGLILGGKVWKGIDDIAGHLGHIIVDPGGPTQVYDNPGSVEALCSATAIIRDARAAARAHPDSRLAEVGSDQMTGKEVFDAAQKGDKVALELFERLGRHLGIACASLANALNPEIGVIGGGLSLAWPFFSGPMIKEMERRALPPAGKRLKLVQAQLLDDAGMVGAAGLAMLRLDGKL